MSAFIWNPHKLSHLQHYAHWNGMYLWADKDGQWSVFLMPTRKEPGKFLITHDDQTKGKDINEAKQRAQAAAIVQLQLTGVKPQ